MSELYRMLGREREAELQRLAIGANSRRTSRRVISRNTRRRRLLDLFATRGVSRLWKPVKTVQAEERSVPRVLEPH